jgi:hypothetical protein
VTGIADLLAGVDVDQHSHRWPILTTGKRARAT